MQMMIMQIMIMLIIPMMRQMIVQIKRIDIKIKDFMRKIQILHSITFFPRVTKISNKHRIPPCHIVSFGCTVSLCSLVEDFSGNTSDC